MGQIPLPQITFFVAGMRCWKLLLSKAMKHTWHWSALKTTYKIISNSKLPHKSFISQSESRMLLRTYMAGYVAIKFKKKYKQHSSNPTLWKKQKILVAVLSKMTADNQPPGCGQSQLIGVGYVYRINNELMPHCSPFHTGATHPYNQSFYFIHSSRFIFWWKK